MRPKEELADSPGKSFVFHVSVLLFPYIRSRYGCHCITLTLLDMAVTLGAVAMREEPRQSEGLVLVLSVWAAITKCPRVGGL